MAGAKDKVQVYSGEQVIKEVFRSLAQFQKKV